MRSSACSREPAGGGAGGLPIFLINDAVLVHSLHDNNLHDWSSLIWTPPCFEITTRGLHELAQNPGYMGRIELGRARPYQPTRLHEGATQSSKVCYGTCRYLNFHGVHSGGVGHGG
jgi:hypothetical protein